MIEMFMDFMNEKVIVIVDGNEVRLGQTNFGAVTTTIDGLKLNHIGVIKEHPDLKDNPDWRKIVIERFKEHIKSLRTEDDVVDYIKNDLKKYGYIPRLKKKKGFRGEVIEWMALLDNLLTVGILLALAIIGYCKIKDVTLTEFWRELMEIFRGSQEEVTGWTNFLK